MALRPNIPVKPKTPGSNSLDHNKSLLDYVMDKSEMLTAKEIDFVESIEPKMRAGINLSEAQEQWLESIHKKVSWE